MDFTKLEELMKNKKKETASKDKKNDYATLMQQLYSEEKYSEKYEKYLFEGFSYFGSEILFDSIGKISKEERLSIFHTIKKGKLFALNDKGITLKLLVSMLAQMINRFPTEYQFIKEIIKVLPDFSKSKEKKLFGTAPKTVQKYFVQELNKNAQLPSFSKLELKDIFIKDFKDVMIQSLQKSKPHDEIQKKKTQHILLWLGLQPGNTEELTTSTSSDSPKANVANEEIPVVAGDMVSESVLSELLVNQKKMERSLAQLNDLYVDYRSLSEQKDILHRKVNNLTIDNEDLKNSNLELNSLLKNTEQELISRKKMIEDLEEQLGKHKDVVSVYAYDKEKSKSELLNALGAKLQAEYNEYKDALDMDMSVPLGENLRDQLGMVFRLLSKSGITFEER